MMQLPSFADDMVMMVPTTEALLHFIGVCQVCATIHNIVYNTTKKDCMVVPSPHSRVDYHTLAWVSGSALTFVDKFTYLGHVINRERMMKSISRSPKYVHGNTLLRKFSF